MPVLRKLNLVGEVHVLEVPGTAERTWAVELAGR